MITNCIFCHPGEVEVIVNSDFEADSAGLYALLVKEEPTPYVPAACAFKRLVVPGKPEESLLYLELSHPSSPRLRHPHAASRAGYAGDAGGGQ